MTEFEFWLTKRIEREREARDPEGVVAGLETALQAVQGGFVPWTPFRGPLASEEG